MQHPDLTRAELCPTTDAYWAAIDAGAIRHKLTPELLRVYSVVQHKENIREFKMAAAKRALAIANKLKNPLSKKLHQSRIFSALNKLRAA